MRQARRSEENIVEAVGGVVGVGGEACRLQRLHELQPPCTSVRSFQEGALREKTILQLANSLNREGLGGCWEHCVMREAQSAASCNW
jgi:hypothetical protein